MTQFTLLVANGTVAPQFLVVRQEVKIDFELEDCEIQYIPTTKSRKERRGEEGVLAFLEYHEKLKTFKPGDVLISDHENAFDTEAVRDKLAAMGVAKLNFPNGLGHLTDPCDNEFHSVQKNRYYSIIAGLDIAQLSFQSKIEAMHSSYYAVGEDAVRNYFLRCGILSDEKPENLAKKLLGECIYVSEGFAEFHREQGLAYANWRLNPDNISSAESSGSVSSDDSFFEDYT
jgi:hypothetical protein